MHRPILLALLLALTCTWPTLAQPGVPSQAGAPEDPVGVVRSWYRQFLEREADATGLATWPDQLRRGEAPAAVLAGLLSSEEYYQRAGSTPEGFVRALFVDLTGRVPAPQEWQEWVRRARTGDRKAVAHDLLQRHAKAWQPPTDRNHQNYLTNVQEQLRRLAAEVERFQEDVVVDLNGPRERELYQRADAVLAEIRQFRRALNRGVSREQLREDFRQMDRKLHDLLETMRAFGPKHPPLLRAAARLRQADQQLHYALFQGDTSEETSKQLVVRQAHALAGEGQEFYRTAQYALAGDRPGRRALEEDIRDFAAAAEHLHRSLEAGFNRAHLVRDLNAVEKVWARVVRGLRVLSPRENEFLVRRAERIDLVLDRLHRQLALEGERPRFSVPLDRH